MESKQLPDSVLATAEESPTYAKSSSPSMQQIADFMKLAGQEVPEQPTIPSDEVRLLRARLILEEALETIERGLGLKVLHLMDDGERYRVHFDDLSFEVVGEPDIVELVDGCCDLEVVTKGTLLAFGVRDHVPQRLVNDNNLEKFGPGGRRDADTGKWLKPPGHKPPDIAHALRLQGCPEELLTAKE